jgi:hypothetical protein
MVKKVGWILILCGVLIFSNCPNPVMEKIDPKTNYAIRIFPVPAHGTITLSDEYAPRGAYVTAYVNPDPGYVLKDDRLILQSEVDGNASTSGRSGTKYQIPVTEYNIAVTAVFEPKTGANYTVSIDRSLDHGTMYAYPLFAAPGTQIRLFLIPDEGYDLAAGSLKFDDGTVVNEQVPYTFILPNRDVSVSALFEEKSYSDLLVSADKYLDAGEYDTAASFYQEAYKKNKNDPEAILYATFAELGGMLLDADIRSIFSSFFMENVPAVLDDWICDADWVATNGTGRLWYSEWAGVQYDTAADNKNPPMYIHTTYTTETIVFPKMNSRLSNVFVGQFGDSPLGQGAATTQKLSNLIFWGLIASNSGGFNGLVERINRYIFGDKFEAIAKRAESFPLDGRVLLNGRLKERFKLDELYGTGDTYIGKTELDYIFANLYAIKAFFEYFAVYDLSIDLRPWLTSQLEIDDGLDQILDKIFSQASSNDNHKAYWRNPATVGRILPFKNNFLNVRNTAFMGKARADLSKALDMANSSMSSWYGSTGTTTHFISTAKARHQWAKDGLAHAQTAFGGDGVFYFPKKLPKSEAASVWPSSADAGYGLNLAEFFKPGAFSPAHFFTTEWGGRIPALFKVKWYEDKSNNWAAVITEDYQLLTGQIPSAARDNIDSNVDGTGNSAPYGIYTFEMNTKYLKQLFPKGFDNFGDKAPLYKVFPYIPLWPTRPTYFMTSNLSARNLYYHYHWE